MRTFFIYISLFIFSNHYADSKTWKDYFKKASNKFHDYKFSCVNAVIERSFSLLPDTTQEFFNELENELLIDSLYFMRGIIKTIIGDSSSVSDFHKMRYYDQTFPYYHDAFDTVYSNNRIIEIYNNSGWYKQDPDIIQTLINIGTYFQYEKKSFIKAKRCFQMVSVLQSDSAEDSDYAFHKLSAIGMEFKKDKYCVEISNEFILRFPNPEDSTLIDHVYSNMLTSLFRLRKYNDILPLIDKMIARGLDINGFLYYDRSISYYNIGNKSLACDDFNVAINKGFKIKSKSKMEKIICN